MILALSGGTVPIGNRGVGPELPRRDRAGPRRDRRVIVAPDGDPQVVRADIGDTHGQVRHQLPLNLEVPLLGIHVLDIGVGVGRLVRWRRRGNQRIDVAKSSVGGGRDQGVVRDHAPPR